jgi:hypothetical protein
MIMLMEDYALPEVDNQEERVESLESLFDDHHLLLAGFWNKVKVLVKNKKFALIPEPLFLQENISDYIRVNISLNEENESFFYNAYSAFGFVNAFAVNKYVKEFLVDKTYPSREVSFFHQSSALITGYQHYFRNNQNQQAAIYIDRFVMHICVFRDGYIRFYNHYPIKKFDDYFRFIGYVCQEMSLNPSRDPFYVWGYLGKKSKHFDSLKSKYPSLRFGERPSDLKLSYVFDGIPEHQYFDLLSFNFLS